MSESERCRFLGTSPHFLVVDVRRAAAYYRGVLGFEYDHLWGEPPRFCMPTRDGFIFMLGEAQHPAQVCPCGGGVTDVWGAYVWITDVEGLFADQEGKGATMVSEPVTRSLYGMREFAVRDLDGYVIAFGQDWSAAGSEQTVGG